MSAFYTCLGCLKKYTDYDDYSLHYWEKCIFMRLNRSLKQRDQLEGYNRSISNQAPSQKVRPLRESEPDHRNHPSSILVLSRPGSSPEPDQNKVSAPDAGPP